MPKRPLSKASSRSAPRTSIAVQGARVHNLRNISVDIPRDRMIVITGLSGSGKSSLAFDTIYAEGQRRYLESLSSYAKRFVAQVSEARRRFRVRPVAGDLDRAEDHRQQPALDRRHDDRHRQLPEPALRDDRRTALSANGRGRAEPVGEPDPRGHPVAAGRGRNRAARTGLQGLRRGSRGRLHRGAQEGLPHADHRRQAGRHLGGSGTRRRRRAPDGRHRRPLCRLAAPREGDQGRYRRDAARRRWACCSCT